nr:retrotransposon protein, putative, Ty3-gypsy subclass [Tanacetum cinerariifolium]GEW27217.1 retrotransposon protein, putative, Ty3-gypsy subclass [Tanacetum cinerariifolium]
MRRRKVLAAFLCNMGRLSLMHRGVKYEAEALVEILKDYDANIQYHPGKANVVEDTLSRKNYGIMACLKIQPEIIKDLEIMKVEIVIRDSEGYIVSLKIETNLILWIKEAQKEDGKLWSMVQNIKKGKHKEFRVDDHGVICSPFFIHPGTTKMYKDLKKNLWWNGMKHDVARFVAKCLTCQQVKIEHQRQGYTVSKLAEIFNKRLFAYMAHLHQSCQIGIRISLHDFGKNNLNEVGELVIKGPESVEVTNEKVAIAIQKLKEARSRQKSYTDHHRRALEFKPGDRVFLKVSPCIGYNYHLLHVIQYSFDKIRKELSFVKEPEAILDRQERVMRKQTIHFVKVL